MRISDCSDVCSSDLADIGPYLQGRGGKGDDPFQRQTPQPQGPELGLPGASFRAGIFHHHLSEAEAGEKPLHEALPFPVLAENLHRRSEEHTSELQSLMRISYAAFCLKKKQL